MALEPRDLGATTVVFPTSSPKILVKDNKAVKIAAIAGDIILEQGFPLKESATPGTYEPWATLSEIACFISNRRHQSSSTGETLAVVMVAGDIHLDAVQLPAGQTQPNLEIELKNAELGKRGIRVFGLADISL